MGADDAWALQMILKAENVDLIAITTVFGNTLPENAARNTYRILDGVNRTNVRIFNLHKKRGFTSETWSEPFHICL